MLRFFFVVVTFFFSQAISAQAFLDVEINYQARNLTITEILFDISELGGFDFSYNAKSMSEEPVLTLVSNGKTVKVLLDVISAESGIQYRVYDTGVILYKPKPKKVVSITHYLSGTVYNDSTKGVLANVKIEEPYLAITTYSDSNGVFKVRIPNPDYRIQLLLSKEQFLSKEIKIRLNEDQQLKVSLSPVVVSPIIEEVVEIDSIVIAPVVTEEEKEAEKRLQDLLTKPIEKLEFVKNVLKDKLKNMANDTSEIHLKGIQFGIVPSISTDFYNGGYYKHHFTASAVINYEAALDGAGFAGVGSFTRFNSKGGTFAGVFSLVGGMTEGVQMSGVVGISRMKVLGFQASGVMSVAGLEMKGVQASGVFSSTLGYMRGLQLAGVFNEATKGGEGLQMSGVLNYTGESFEGIQASGVLNVSRDTLNGMQLSTINLADNVVGHQIGVVNVCNEIKGIQFGVINIAKTSNEGMPIGLLSIVKNGYKKIELEYQESGMTNLRFKTGTDKFYNIIGGGYKKESSYDDFYWSIIYGVGHNSKLGKRWGLNTDLTATQLQRNKEEIVFNMKSTLGINLVYQTKWVNIMAGPTANILFTDDSFDFPIESGQQFYDVESAFSSAWVGFSIGLQFL